MVDRITPEIGDPAKPDKPKRIKVSKTEVKKWLEKRKLPNTSQYRKRARKKIRSRKELDLIPRGRDLSVVGGNEPWQIIYGRVRCGGVISFLHTSNNKSYLNHVVTWACHQIHDFEKLFLDGNEVTITDQNWATGGTKPNGDPIDYTNKVWIETKPGTTGQSALGQLQTDLPTYWTSNHKQSNRAHSHIRLVWDATLFGEGAPEIWAQIRGKLVYDPRTASTTWSANAALCIADYLMDSVYGLGFPLSEIDTDSLEEAADYCDEAVALDAGGTEARYEVNGLFDTEMSHDDILSEMCVAMAGHITYTNGKWKFYPGVYRTPTVTLTDDDLRSAPELETIMSRVDLVNSVRGQYVSADNAYTVKDYPPMVISAYVTEDGENLWDDIPLSAVTSASQAQRVAKIHLEKTRRQITHSASWGLNAMQLDVGDTVMLDSDRYGFSSKVFEVQDWDFSVGDNMEIMVDLVLRETDSSVYDWDETQDEQAVNVAPRTDLPDASVADPPSALNFSSGTGYLVVQGDGSIAARVFMEWTAPDDAFVTEGGYYQIQAKPTADAYYYDQVLVDGAQENVYLLGLYDGETYDIRMRSINALGVKSDWVASSHTVIGKTAKPNNPTGLSASISNNNVKLSWTANTDLDISHYELRVGSSWAAGTFVAFVYGTNYEYQASTAQSYSFFLKAIDTTGNKSPGSAQANITLNGPNQIQNLSTKVIDNNVLIDWDEPSSSTFPVGSYKVYEGATFGSATYLGKVAGTFFNYFSQLAGSFTYWVVAVDIKGNEGTETSISTTQYSPPDYILRAEQFSDLDDGTLSNAVEHDYGDDSFVAPVITTETWATHFTNNSWTDIDDADGAGYDIFATPSNGTDGYYEEEIDLGAVVAGSRINLSYTTTILDGGVTVTPTISYKKLSGDSWTDNAGESEVFADDFQYIKIKIEVAGDDDTSIARISNIQTRVDVKKQTDSGSGTSSASLATTVSFNLDFLDIESITVSARGAGTEGYSEAIDFTDGPNPTDFDVYFFDKDGNQVAVDFFWTAEGFVNP